MLRLVKTALRSTMIENRLAMLQYHRYRLLTADEVVCRHPRRLLVANPLNERMSPIPI